MTKRFTIRQLTGILVWSAWDLDGDAPIGELFTDLSEIQAEVKKLNSSPQPPYDNSLEPIGIYARISDDSEEKGEGVLRQLQDGRGLAKKIKARVKDYYVDNDKSASTRTNTVRPDYDRMLEDARSRKITLIGAYSNGRVTRRPMELEALIKLYEQHHTVIHTVVSGQDDLSTADGRMVARIKASVDAAEVERLAERVTRQKKMRAEQGKPQGSRYRTYGFTRDWELVLDELAFVADMFKRRLGGESNTSIAESMAKEGAKTSEGNDWRSGVVDSTLRNPIYAGLRRYKGEVIGKIDKDSIPHIEDVYPVITAEQFELVQSELVKDSKGTNSRTYLGSGFLICKNCLTRFKGNAYTKNYRCSINYGGCGRISVRIENTDLYIRAMVMAEHLTAVSREHRKNKPTPRDFDAEVATFDAAIEKLQEGWNNGIYELAEVQPLIKEQREKRKLVLKEKTLEDPEIGPVNHIKTYMDFHKASMSEKRAIVGRYIENIVVHPSPAKKGSHNFHPERLEFHFTDGRIEFADASILEDPEHED